MTSNSASMPSGKRISFGHPNIANASLIIEKQKATLRRSTPDSEALASSEDEQDLQQRSSLAGSTSLASRHPRRASWINDTHSHLPRKSSFGTTEPRSPGGLQHASNTSESNNWSSTPMSSVRHPSNSTSLPWNSAIWNNDTQKGLPTRLTEVLPSPTALGSPAAYHEEALHSPSRRDSASEAAIPFAIPLQPTLKSYRSQSYSVGQLDQEPTNSGQMRPTQHTYGVRTRAGSSYAGLQHRPSRPSVLGEFSTDSSTLGQLREVDDDEESAASSDAHTRFSNNQARKIEQLAMENAILRQRAQLGQPSGVHMPTLPYPPNSGPSSRASNRGLQISESVLEEPDDDQAVDDDLMMAQTLPQRAIKARRPSEYAAGASGHLINSSDQRSFVHGKKGQWQSSLGFGGSIEVPQSRRHSFADVPLRHGSNNALDIINGNRAPDGHSQFTYGELNPMTLQPDNTFLPHGLGHQPDNYRALQGQNAIQGSYSGHQQARLDQFGSVQPHQPQLLYLVTFKAARAEFYYIQEGTGLDVNPGDLVIVEADRGTDLGTVAHKNVDWASARELKEHYVTEHYNWLMMFSRQGQHGQNAGQYGWNQGARPEKTNPNPVGAIGPQGALSSGDGVNAEIKPKMIKRLAQNHEIHTLREKEGNEAKAKRMCQQKVAEHHLNMEILDAEFQMDWKKLTFYYFADSYINFNSLVTDLFKIYKTRIWMSAINPASFVSPSTGLQLPPGIAQNGGKADRSRFSDPRSNIENAAAVGSSAPENSNDQMWHLQNERNVVSPPGAYNQYWPGAGFLQTPHTATDFQLSNVSGLRSNPMLNASFDPISGSRPQSKSEYKSDTIRAPYGDQLQAFQGLTLGPS